MTINNFNGLTAGKLRELIKDIPDDVLVISSRGDHVYANANENGSDNDVRIERAIWHDPDDADFHMYENGWEEGFFEVPRWEQLPEEDTIPVITLGYSS
jgi:hypothetical protein